MLPENPIKFKSGLLDEFSASLFLAMPKVTCFNLQCMCIAIAFVVELDDKQQYVPILVNISESLKL